MREYKFDLTSCGGPACFIARVPDVDINKYLEWLEDARCNVANIRAITKEMERLEEEMFLQAATECEKDFQYLEDNIKAEEYVDDKNGKEYLVLPVHHPDGWSDCWW